MNRIGPVHLMHYQFCEINSGGASERVVYREKTHHYNQEMVMNPAILGILHNLQ